MTRLRLVSVIPKMLNSETMLSTSMQVFIWLRRSVDVQIHCETLTASISEIVNRTAAWLSTISRTEMLRACSVCTEINDGLSVSSRVKRLVRIRKFRMYTQSRVFVSPLMSSITLVWPSNVLPSSSTSVRFKTIRFSVELVVEEDDVEEDGSEEEDVDCLVIINGFIYIFSLPVKRNAGQYILGILEIKRAD